MSAWERKKLRLARDAESANITRQSCRMPVPKKPKKKYTKLTDWCPHGYRELYRQLRKVKGPSVAKYIVEMHLAKRHPGISAQGGPEVGRRTGTKGYATGRKYTNALLLVKRPREHYRVVIVKRGGRKAPTCTRYRLRPLMCRRRLSGGRERLQR